MKTKVLNILSEIRSEFDFSTSTNFIEDGMLDSFDIVTLVTMLDEEFELFYSKFFEKIFKQFLALFCKYARLRMHMMIKW